MKTVIAAIDNSLAARPVIATARALATVLEAQVEAVHVRAGGDRTARGAADAAGLQLRAVVPPVVEALVEAGEAEDVVAVAIGARGTAGGPRPIGGTATAVATALLKPVVVVPPDAAVPAVFRRVLVPLEGSASASLAPAALIELAGGEQLDVVALHVHELESMPSFTDQPQHELGAWAQEFLARHLPSGLGKVRLETRVGRTDELVPLVAAECDCDLIALGWSRELGPGRARVVRSTLERSRLPVALIPVRPVRNTGSAVVGAGELTGR